MTSILPKNLSTYQPLIFWTWILHLMAITIIKIVLEKSLLPFLGDALSWLMGTATTKDVNSIKKRVNQLIKAQ